MGSMRLFTLTSQSHSVRQFNQPCDFFKLDYGSSVTYLTLTITNSHSHGHSVNNDLQ